MSLKWCPDATTNSPHERYLVSLYPSLRSTPERTAVLVQEFFERHRFASFYTFDLKTIEKGEAVFRGNAEMFYFDADGKSVSLDDMQLMFPEKTMQGEHFALSVQCRPFKDCPHGTPQGRKRSCDFFSESYHPEIRLPLTHPIFERDEPVRYFVWTEAHFPRKDMAQFMTFRRA